MKPTPNLALVGRKQRCRMRDALDDRCPNEVLDADPAAPQLCLKHAYEGVKLLESTGALTTYFAVPDRPWRFEDVEESAPNWDI